MIEFSLSDEQKALQELARDFAQKEIAPVASQLDRTGEYPYDLLKQAHKLGLLNLTIEDKYGGGGVGWLEACIVGEEFSAACAGVTSRALKVSDSMNARTNGLRKERTRSFKAM